jgi:tRNA-2-methylthio-N6-dimethylallyladenosine synthase
MTDLHKTIILHNKAAFIITYGCQMNEADSEKLMGQLGELGYTAAATMADADLILINTCCVRESAEKKILGKIGELKRLKTENPQLIIAIAGCMAQKDRDQLLKKAPHIDLILGTNNVHGLSEAVTRIEQTHEKIVAVFDQTEAFDVTLPAKRRGTLNAWVPIMYGCNNFCTYCIVPYVRGRERSRPPQDILDEIKQLATDGFKEITLLGQNVNSYGKDMPEGLDFAGLLTAIDQSNTIERIRYMTSHPRDMTKQAIDVIAASHHICEHFHLPIQSGSDEIMQRMNRGYNRAAYREIVRYIRQVLPQSSLTTDLIVGFPGETDDMFNETLEFIGEIRFDAAYTFLYSQRSGTPAATLTDQVPELVKKERLNRLMDRQNEISLAINKALEGQVVEVLTEGPSKNDEQTFMGRTRTNKIILWPKDLHDQAGQLVAIRVEKAQTWVLKGQKVR